MRKRILLSAVVLVFGFFLAANASADFSFELSTPNAALGPFPGPYALVEFKYLNSTTVDVSFTGLNGYAFVNGGSVALNVNAASFSVSNIQWTMRDAVAVDSTSVYQVPAQNVDGFKKFNLVFDQPTASNPVTMISFTLTNASPEWSDSLYSILTGNGSGWYAAAHVVPEGSSTTGYAANAVPIPAAVWLLGSGLIGLVGLRRRFKK
jgi:hypothetical protein